MSERAVRMLRDWSSLTAKLPLPAAGLQRFSATPPPLRLDTQESKVWQLALGDLSIAQIAAKLALPVEKVQQVGYRLIAIGLIQEVSLEPLQPPVDKMMDLPKLITANQDRPVTAVSTSFLSKLVGFLKQKA